MDKTEPIPQPPLEKYYDTRQQSDGLWYIVGSLDGAHWYYLYEDIFKFSSQPEARAWLIAEGYTYREIGIHIQKAVVVHHISLSNRTGV